MEFGVAFVCTGNRFRSPLAAAVFSQRVEDTVRVESLGTLDLEAAPPLPEAIAAAAELGVDFAHHRTRPLTKGSLADHDLVLGFEWKHVAAAVVDGGAARERTFTLPELVELIGRIDAPSTPAAADRARALLERVAPLRGRDTGRVPEVVDPLGRPPQVQRQIARQVATLAERLAEELFGKTALR